MATTARAWLAQLATSVPVIDGDTVWNDVPDEPAALELALRARIAWLSAGIGEDTVQLLGEPCQTHVGLALRG